MCGLWGMDRPRLKPKEVWDKDEALPWHNEARCRRQGVELCLGLNRLAFRRWADSVLYYLRGRPVVEVSCREPPAFRSNRILPTGVGSSRDSISQLHLCAGRRPLHLPSNHSRIWPSRAYQLVMRTLFDYRPLIHN